MKRIEKIIEIAESKMDLAERAYMLGFIDGQKEISGIPVYGIPQISDKRWQELANKKR